MAELDSFRATGLLGGTFDTASPRSGAITPPSLLGVVPFVSNGLLEGNSRESTTLEKSYCKGIDDTLVEDQFVSNGLLPSRKDCSAELLHDESVVDVPLESQDIFPNVSDILRPYAKKAESLAVVTSTTPNTNPGSANSARFLIRATNYDGKTVHLKRKQVKAKRFDADSMSRAQISNLLDVPIHRLMDQLSSVTAAKLANPAQVRKATDTSRKVQCSLWVDRYRPKLFADLLGDERVHRETMAWLKEWDWCVFGKKRGKKRARDDNQDIEYTDEYHRPREKILLLSGPPGLGKTTLAHIVAKQAGYGVFEINASDARSGQIVDDRIRPALEAGSAVGATKPVLVVIDEIDGATGAGDNAQGFVQKLVELTLDKPRKKRGKRDATATRPLLRPIICVCNDLYSSSLTKLRPHARIIRFNRPPDVYIVKRLREICDNEGLKAESRALTTLVGVAKGDLRGCLNTLQFIKARNQEVTETTIRAATVGMKEADTSITSVLNDLFAPMSKKRVKELGLGDEDESKYVDRLSREIEGSGSTDKIAMGCFEHYATIHQHDASFSRCEKANEWLTTYDCLSGAMRSEREYALLPYLSYSMVPFYPLFQERGAPRVERPKIDWENYMKTRTNEEIYHSLSKCIRTGCSRRAGDYRHLGSDQVLRLEFASYINRIISPPLRPVNSQVIRPEERALLSRLVSIMVSLDLHFVQDKAEDGQLVYRLDPPIDVFVTYDGKRASDIAVSRYAARHLVATEIEAQLIVHQAEAIEKYRSSRPTFGRHEEAMEQAENDEPVTGDGKLFRPVQSARLPRQRQNVGKNKSSSSEKIDIADRPPTDFFGRPITTSATPSVKGMARSTVQKNYRVSYKFHEGNSAAVRKPVKIASFI